tara:strand:+ start:915 stop:1130 length:216 start_codon:yes stop_codon:yes gene_type:complete
MQVNYMTPHQWSKIKKLEKIIKKGKKMDQIEKTNFYDIASFKKRYFGTPLLLGAISYGIVYLVKNFEVIKK